ncbi:MAG: hypothetical protein A2520_02690 [Deltaproteobacteria bacterium RIFOXYD12_FULL_53_23]|nr:MAG: hypothetical protein A2520_02690 [Deltaproteobacteria bacterium RIFOXYD12_FULL_53_23]
MVSPVSAVLVAIALGTNKSMWPASIFKDRFTLLLFSILSKKLVQAQTLLKLNSIHFHDDLLWLS